jgi:hypothetical protein
MNRGESFMMKGTKWIVVFILTILLSGCSTTTSNQSTASNDEEKSTKVEDTCPPPSKDSEELMINDQALSAKAVKPMFGGYMKMLTERYEYTTGEGSTIQRGDGKTYKPLYISIDDKNVERNHPQIKMTIEESVGEEPLDQYDAAFEISSSITIHNLKEQDLSQYPELCNFDVFYKGETPGEEGNTRVYALVKAINEKLYSAFAYIPEKDFTEQAEAEVFGMLGSFYLEKEMEDPVPVEIDLSCSQTGDAYTALLPVSMERAGESGYQHKYRPPLAPRNQESVSVDCISEDDFQRAKEDLKMVGDRVPLEEIGNLDGVDAYHLTDTEYAVYHGLIIEKEKGKYLKVYFQQNKQGSYEKRKDDIYAFIDSFKLK